MADYGNDFCVNVIRKGIRRFFAYLFVIAGGGTGIPVYRHLQKKRIPFITGILHENDVDYQVARALSSAVISERAFQPISDETFNTACTKLAACTEVLNCLGEYGEMNLRNKELLEWGLHNGCKAFICA